jgi:hypothetical protein
MRVIKLSSEDVEMGTEESVQEFFSKKLASTRPSGKFKLTARRISATGIEAGELLIFSYHGQLLYWARAASDRRENDGEDSALYPHYFLIDVSTIESIRGTLSELESALSLAGIFNGNIVQAQGWPIVPSAGHAEEQIVGLLSRFRSTGRATEADGVRPELLSPVAMALLQELVVRLEGGSIRVGRPETYPRYGEVHRALRLEMQGETVGQSLRRQGLEELALWTRDGGYPAVTGLIVDDQANMPAQEYFAVYGQDEFAFQWWETQVRDSIGFNWRQFLPEQSTITKAAADIEPPSPERVAALTYGILRDTELARRVKRLHGYRCQFCGSVIHLPDGSLYAEAHHIRPLGQPHSGPDVEGNVLCLCPNHHAELDYGVFAFGFNDLRTANGHDVLLEFIDYHNRNIAGSSSSNIDAT